MDIYKKTQIPQWNKINNFMGVLQNYYILIIAKLHNLKLIHIHTSQLNDQNTK